MKTYTHPVRAVTRVQRKDGSTFLQEWVYLRPTLRLEGESKAWTTLRTLEGAYSFRATELTKGRFISNTINGFEKKVIPIASSKIDQKTNTTSSKDQERLALGSIEFTELLASVNSGSKKA